jgi:hypothetical protein
VRENDTLFPVCLQEPPDDDSKEDLEPSVAELPLEERPGEHQAKTTDKETPRSVPKGQGEYPGKQPSNIQPAVNYGDHLDHQMHEQGRWTQLSRTPWKHGPTNRRLYEEKKTHHPGTAALGSRPTTVPTSI